MPVDLKELEDRLWTAADSFQANAGPRPSEYSRPVLGLLFSRYAEARFFDSGEGTRCEGQGPPDA
jgi:type I restriction enzyme M protein